MKKDKSAVLVGVAQYTQRKIIESPLDPLALIIKACENAIKDTNANSSQIIDSIDTIFMTNIRSWSYEDAPGELGKTLGIIPRRRVYLPDGGNTPQALINRASRDFFHERSKAILITGGECFYTAYKSKKIKNWPPSKKPSYMEGELWDGINEFENSYGLKNPSISYAIFETALRKSLARTVEEHQLSMGKLFERFSKIASENPFSWTKESFSAKEIINPTPSNRMINYPYTKRMCANMFVDQSAALLMMTVEQARDLGIDENYWVYLRGGADFQNVYEITRRPNLHDSPAARVGSKRALNQAGISLKDIHVFDIYSCFPSIIQIIKNEIGIPEGDSRDLTIAGGLPYFGGPWSNYSMHAVVTAVEKIRTNPALNVMIVANGGYNHKQSFGLYGRTPPVISWEQINDEEMQDLILSKALDPPQQEANGTIQVEGYTLVYNRKGNPIKGIFIGTLGNGRRTLAQLNAEPDMLSRLLEEDMVGKKFVVHFDNSVKINIIELT